MMRTGRYVGNPGFGTVMPDDFGVPVDDVIATVSPEFAAEVTGKAALAGPNRHNRVP